MGNPNSQQLSSIMASVGLAQNFGALRTLVSEGIQKGHMGLHAKNIAIRVGVPDILIPEVIDFMKSNKLFNDEAARQYMKSHEIYTDLRKNLSSTDVDIVGVKFSTFYLELDYSFLKEPIFLNILLNTSLAKPIHLCIKSRNVSIDDKRIENIYHLLVGKDKNFDWIHEFLNFVTLFESHRKSNTKNSINDQNPIKMKLELILILCNLICYNLLKIKPDETKKIIEMIIKVSLNLKNYRMMIQ